MNNFTVVIPARYNSSRLPGKPLEDIAGKPMVIRVIEQALQTAASRVIVATDSIMIHDVVCSYGYESCLTSTEHNSGTERLAEVIQTMNIDDNEIIVNVQGDEPLIPPSIIQQVADNLVLHQVHMATLAVHIHNLEELFNPNIVKVTLDKNGFALYFSRAVIPWQRDYFSKLHLKPNQIHINGASKQELLTNIYLRHIGIYAYRAWFINHYIQLAPSELEKLESLEQLRVLWHGEKIHVGVAIEEPAIGVDTYEDLDKVRFILEPKR